MESRFDTNNFERSLREQADKFFLIPSERVWKSIYNDLHPGSKWPSLGVGIILLISLFWIGNSHTSTVNPITTKKVVEKTLISIPVKESNTINTSTSEIQIKSETGRQPVSTKSIAEKTILLPVAAGVVRGNKEQPTANALLLSEKTENKIDEVIAVHPVVNNSALTAGIHSNISPGSFTGMNRVLNDKKETPVLSDKLLRVINSATSEQVANKEKDQAAKVPSAIGKKLKRKAQWTLFVTPERGYVHFRGSNLNQPVQSLVATSPNTVHKVNARGRYGIQAGADVKYKLAGNLDFTSGFHLSYNGYNIMAELAHPSLASVTFRNSKDNLFTKNYMSYYGNSNNGSLKIANYNMQFAIPVGLQWTLFEEGNVKVSVVSTVEPFLVLGSQAYILSGDGKKFVNDPDLMRRVNLNGSFGSVVTFSSHNINWNIGPSVRYQVLSTYQNIYPIREHLINYGLRIGISKPR